MDDDASYTTWDLDKIDKEYNRKKRLFFFYMIICFSLNFLLSLGYMIFSCIC